MIQTNVESGTNKLSVCLECDRDGTTRRRRNWPRIRNLPSDLTSHTRRVDPCQEIGCNHHQRNSITFVRSKIPSSPGTGYARRTLRQNRKRKGQVSYLSCSKTGTQSKSADMRASRASDLILQTEFIGMFFGPAAASPPGEALSVYL